MKLLSSPVLNTVSDLFAQLPFCILRQSFPPCVDCLVPVTDVRVGTVQKPWMNLSQESLSVAPLFSPLPQWTSRLFFSSPANLRIHKCNSVKKKNEMSTTVTRVCECWTSLTVLKTVLFKFELVEQNGGRCIDWRDDVVCLSKLLHCTAFPSPRLPVKKKAEQVVSLSSFPH